MHLVSRTSSDGVTEQVFTLDGVPAVLWTPRNAAGPRPLILIGHGGGEHKKAPGVEARARRFVVEGGFAVASVDAPNHGDRPVDPDLLRIATGIPARVAAGEEFWPLITALHTLAAERSVPEWRAVLTAVQGLDEVGPGPVGYWGVSMGCGLGVPFVAAEPRVRAAVVGLSGSPAMAALAAGITVPVQYLVQWEDERIPREVVLAVFDAWGSAEKTLHANAGGHGELPEFETGSAVEFFRRHL